MKTRRLTTRDISMLRQHIQEKARTTVHQPEGLLQHPFVIPTYDAVAGADDSAHVAERSATGAYLQMYDWDSCLFSQSAHRAGLTGLPLAVVRNFLSLQTPDGFIPRTVSPGRVWDQGDLCKPFLSQTLLAEMERTNWAELNQIEPMLDALERFLGHYRSNRRHETGLYYWRNVLESGVDDNYALLAPHEADKDEDQTCVRYPDGRLLATDLNSYLVAEMRAHSQLAFACGRKAQGQKSATEADQLAALIEEKLWDASLSMYVNLDPVTGKTVQLRSWTGLAPAFFGVSSRSRVLEVLQNNVLNEQHFLRAYGIASMAASELLSNQAPRGLYGRAIVCNWNGPVWIMPNVLVVRTLLKVGMRTQAKNVARRVLAAMIKDLKETGRLHENYNADTGASLWAPCFMSWNIMALELIDLIEVSAKVKVPQYEISL
jgi:putative isomerase